MPDQTFGPGGGPFGPGGDPFGPIPIDTLPLGARLLRGPLFQQLTGPIEKKLRGPLKKLLTGPSTYKAN